jgi:hypothetical protein
MKDTKFDDIRPYYEEEIPAAMQRIAESQFFPLLASYVYPNRDIETIREMIRGFRTISDFQLEVMRCVNEQVIARSITELTYNGVEQLDPAKRYLFISNHRDIMLDSSLMQYILYKNGHETTEITFGANLMINPLVIDIGKSNKMFRVERSGNMKDFYRSSLHLSEYIRYALTEKNQSVWIAQRNGRTKDGNDATDQGIIKMFCMSKPQDKIEALSELNIIPVSVSYEWESCDILKALELYESKQQKYIKKPGEDLNSILTGIVQPKGKVHFEFCKQVTKDDLMEYSESTNNEYHKKVATLLDRRICSAYRLTPNNYIAHDLRYGRELYRNHYTDEQKKTFMDYMQRLNQYDDCDLDALKDIFLSIYANPVNHVHTL